MSYRDIKLAKPKRHISDKSIVSVIEKRLPDCRCEISKAGIRITRSLSTRVFVIINDKSIHIDETPGLFSEIFSLGVEARKKLLREVSFYLRREFGA